MRQIEYMQIAYAEAVKAADRGEVPVGAVLVDGDGAVMSRAGNCTIEHCDPCAHAEIIVLREAGRIAANYRLVNAAIYVTLEPCVMCMGAMIHARIARLIFAVPDPKTGAVVSRYRIGTDGLLNHSMIIESGVMADECGQLLKSFFKARRK